MACWFRRVASDTLKDPTMAPAIEELWRRQGGKCALTGVLLEPGGRRVSLDHITPRARGGSHDISNLRWVTYEANRAKSALADAEFLELCKCVVATLGAGQPGGAHSCTTISLSRKTVAMN